MEGHWTVHSLVLKVDVWLGGRNCSTVLGLDIVDRLGLLEQNVNVRGSATASLESGSDKFFNSVIGNHDVELLGRALRALEPENVLGGNGDLTGVNSGAVVSVLTRSVLFRRTDNGEFTGSIGSAAGLTPALRVVVLRSSQASAQAQKQNLRAENQELKLCCLISCCLKSDSSFISSTSTHNPGLGTCRIFGSSIL